VSTSSQLSWFLGRDSTRISPRIFKQIKNLDRLAEKNMNRYADKKMNRYADKNMNRYAG